MSKIYERLSSSINEQEVADEYIKNLKKYMCYEKVTYIYGCDGYIEGTIKCDKDKRIINLLMEFKKDKNFYNKRDKCEVILQALYYAKDFINNSCKTPEVLLIGDKKACFLLGIKDVINYIDMDIDWTIAPSSAAANNKELIEEMIKDKNINPFVFKIDESFQFKNVIDEIERLAKGVNRFVKVNQENIILAYDYFITTVIKNVNEFKSDELVQIFIGLLLDPDDNCKHRNNNNLLIMSSGKRVPINGENFDGYFKHFNLLYKPSERRKFTEISDRLIVDTYRRKKGEYYTSTTWANLAHKYISDRLGDSWRNEYYVWDCAWGTGNLTRDYKFDNLFCSTIDNEDLNIGKIYNNEAKAKFQYNFLNDDIHLFLPPKIYDEDIKMPQELLKVFEQRKKIIFFINPPFGAAGSGGPKGGSKAKIANSKVQQLMKNNNLGLSSKQLFAQFLYRILLMKRKYFIPEISICFYSTPIFLTGESFKSFRKEFLKDFKYKGGFLFNANNFSSVKENWGICFSIWKSELSDNIDRFKFDVIDYVNGNINKISEKIFFNTDNSISTATWIREGLKNVKTYDAPQMTNAINIKQIGSGKLVKGALGYCVNSANSVNENNTYVLITSSASCKGHGVSITKENFMKVLSNYSARKLISGKYSNWINIRDEYFKPDINHSKYKEWNNDAIIYSIFSTSSQQSSLRNIIYKDKSYNIKNHFFFESRENIMQYAEDNYNDEVYNDVISDKEEAFVYELLTKVSLSKEALNVLKIAKELVKETFKYRKEFNSTEPKYQINNWDVGWYQIKALINYYDRISLVKFNSAFKILENKMRPLIYELGFLQEEYLGLK
jgi:hypothetical protein